LKTCQMTCDGGLNPKLEMYELTKFMNTHTTNLFLGKPSSGKTSLAYSFFKSNKLMKKTFHNIYVFQPNASRQSMVDNIFGELPTDQLYDELTYENLSEVLDIIKIADKDEKHCIIFDDQTAYLKNKDTLKLLKEMIFNRRHLHISIYFLV
jgi:ABC-type sugar transport system ATPase subunit